MKILVNIVYILFLGCSLTPQIEFIIKTEKSDYVVGEQVQINDFAMNNSSETAKVYKYPERNYFLVKEDKVIEKNIIHLWVNRRQQIDSLKSKDSLVIDYGELNYLFGKSIKGNSQFRGIFDTTGAFILYAKSQILSNDDESVSNKLIISIRQTNNSRKIIAELERIRDTTPVDSIYGFLIDFNKRVAENIDSTLLGIPESEILFGNIIFDYINRQSIDIKMNSKFGMKNLFIKYSYNLKFIESTFPLYFYGKHDPQFYNEVKAFVDSQQIPIDSSIYHFLSELTKENR